MLVARIKQSLEKVFDKNTSLAERIGVLFREQGITTFPVLTALSVTISTIMVAITGAFGVGVGVGSSPPRDEGVLNKWLKRLADALKWLAGKAVEALPAIVESVVSFLGKVVGFVAEHTRISIVFVAGRIGVWLMQRVSRKQAGEVGRD